MTIDDAWSVCELIGSSCDMPTEFIFIRLVYRVPYTECPSENDFNISVGIPTGSVSFYSDVLDNPERFEYLMSVLDLTNTKFNRIIDEDLVRYAIKRISNGTIDDTNCNICLAEEYGIHDVMEQLGIDEHSFIIKLLPFTTKPYIEKLTKNLNVVINNSYHDGIHISTLMTDIKNGAEVLSRFKLAHCQYLLYVYI